MPAERRPTCRHARIARARGPAVQASAWTAGGRVLGFPPGMTKALRIFQGDCRIRTASITAFQLIYSLLRGLEALLAARQTIFVKFLHILKFLSFCLSKSWIRQLNFYHGNSCSALIDGLL